MIPYILNFVLCSGLMLGIYHLLLASESFYRFNRFYLLFSLAFSLVVPLIPVQTSYNIPQVATAIPLAENFTAYQQPENIQIIAPQRQVAVAQTTNYSTYLLPAIYLLVAFALLIRFGINLFQIYRRRATCYTYEHEGTYLSLLKEDVPPHSFLNHIFVAEKDYNIGLDPQIICHERAHVKQLHSVDIIIVELLQIVCWFNPLIPFYRKAIQLNHEFLADEAVVKNYDDMPQYQQLLLVKATQNNGLNLISPFNYLTLKKRLIMMTKTTSAKTALFKKLLILPAIAVTLLLSCDRNSKDQDNLNVTEARLTEPVVERVLRNPYHIKHSAVPAPKQVLDEYAALLKKYNLTGATPNDMPIFAIGEKWSHETQEKMQKIDMKARQKLDNISKTDKARLNQLFKQMDSNQQTSQYLLFALAPKPLPKRSVTAQQLAQWQSSKEYLIILDTKPFHYSDLAKYKPEHFDWVRIGRGLNSQAIKQGFKHKIELMTKPFYATYSSKSHDDRMVYVMKRGGKSRWMVGL